MKLAAILILIFLPVLAIGGTMSETRDFAMPAVGIDTMVINGGAGSLNLRGVSNATTIRIAAQIEGDNLNDDEFKELIRNGVQLSLHKSAKRSILQSDIKPPAGPDLPADPLS